MVRLIDTAFDPTATSSIGGNAAVSSPHQLRKTVQIFFSARVLAYPPNSNANGELVVAGSTRGPAPRGYVDGAMDIALDARDCQDSVEKRSRSTPLAL